MREDDAKPAPTLMWAIAFPHLLIPPSAPYPSTRSVPSVPLWFIPAKIQNLKSKIPNGYYPS